MINLKGGKRDKKKRKERGKERRTGMDRVVHQNFDRTSCFIF